MLQDKFFKSGTFIKEYQSYAHSSIISKHKDTNIFIYSLSAFLGSSLQLVFFDWNLSLERELILTLLVIKMKHYLDIRLGVILLKFLFLNFNNDIRSSKGKGYV